MTDGYEFGGFQFSPVEADWALKGVVNALDRIELMGHTMYRTCDAVLLTHHESWWAITFNHGYQVQPTFSRIIGVSRGLEKKRERVNDEKVFGFTTKQRVRVMKTLAWIKQMDRDLFPLDGRVDSGIPDFRSVEVFHAPECHSTFYVLAPHGVYRVVETEEERLTELYKRTEERVEFVESLLPGQSSEYSPARQWFMVSDFIP